MTLEQIAQALRNVKTSGITISPIRQYLNQGDIDSAYEIQKINNTYRIQQGEKPVGKKIGLTSPSVQKQLGVDQPDYGLLFDTTEVKNGGSIPHSIIQQPKVEAEVAFVLKSDIEGANPSIDDIRKAIDYVVASIEIVGSRIENWDISILDTIADNASASHFVLGDDRVSLEETDLENCQMELIINGNQVSTGSGKACMGSPLIAVQWLAQKMHELGSPLRAGEIILSGALGPMAAVNQGDEATAVIEGLGEVSVTFN